MFKAHGNTTLHEIRQFLSAHGAAPPAWTTARTQVEALYAQLRERRADDGFWRDLADLANRLEDSRVSPALIQGSEVLGGQRVDRLIDDLRASLPANSHGPQTSRAWAASNIGFGALAAFALLGSSLGCVDGTPGGAYDYQDVEEACDEAQDAGITNVDAAEVYCEIVDIIQTADIGESLAHSLLDCLPEYSTSERADLLDAFLDADDDQLVDLLEDMAWSSPCYEGDDDDH